MTILVEHRAQRVHQFGALIDEARAAAEQHRPGLLIFGLGGDEPHLGLVCGDNDRLGIGGIVLLAHYERLDVLRSNKLGVVSQLDHLARPVAGAAARLEHDQAGRLFSHESPELFTRQLLAKRHMARHGRTVELKNTFCQVHPDYRILHLAVLSASWLSDHYFGTSRCRLGRAATTPSGGCEVRLAQRAGRRDEDVAGAVLGAVRRSRLAACPARTCAATGAGRVTAAE